MTQHVHLTSDPEFSGTLPFSRAPGGELTFEFGEASVSDDVNVTHLVDRYPNLEAGQQSIEPMDDEAADDAGGSDDPADYGEWDEAEWLDSDYTDRADLVRTGAVDPFLDEIEAAETSSTVTDAVAARREELESGED